MARTGFGENGFGDGVFGGSPVYAPTVALANVEGGIQVTVTNFAAPDAATVSGNQIERSVNGGPWKVLGAVGSGQPWVDYDATAGQQLVYRAGPLSADGWPQRITGQASIVFDLRGFGIHDPDDPAGTFRSFPFVATLTSETRVAEQATRSFFGRRRPVVDFGEHETADLARGTVIPWDSEHDAAVDWWRARSAARKLLRYRDSRGRDVFGVLGASISITDGAEGTTVAFTFIEVDRVEVA